LAAEVGGPVELQSISDTPINLRITENVDVVYKIIGKLAGINVLFDPEYKAQRIAVELNDVTPREALDMLALQSKTFWQPVSPNTIFVVSDTAGKRKEVQGNVMTTFYLKNVATPTELQDAANTVKGILDVARIQLIPNQNAMVVRGTADQLVLAEKLLDDIDKPKAEVMIDVAVMQVSRDRLRTLGVNPPTSASVTWTTTGANVTPSSGSGGSGSGGSNNNGSNGKFTINSLGHLNSNNFEVSIPGATASFLASDSNTKLIQNPEIRALDNEKATLKIGDRVPVATGSFANTGLSSLVNTQFQYLDVGVNVDITPHIHSDHEVTLKMVLEISSVTGTQEIGGISQPIIGQRRIEHEARLQDGEVNLIGGILEDSETRSLSGYPWLSKVPILKYFFGQEEKDRRQNEIVFAITPHIVRGQELNDENLRVVDVGTGSAVGLRHHDVRTSVAKDASGVWGHPQPARATDSKTGKDVNAAPKVSASVRTPNTASLEPARPVPNIASNQRSATTESAPNARQTAPMTSTASATPSAARLTGKPQTASNVEDPCPQGQHFIGLENGVITCAFN
jgi:general secretion pathway protein D